MPVPLRNLENGRVKERRPDGLSVGVEREGMVINDTGLCRDRRRGVEEEETFA